MKNKIVQFHQLIKDLKNESEIENIIATRNGKSVNVGLVNHFKLHNFIPNKWFDWEPRIDSPIMIIGQDWGPYHNLLKYIEDYEIEKIKSEFDYSKFLFKTFSSRTEKFIVRAIEQTYKDKFEEEFPFTLWDDFIFTVSVFFTRQGKLFRGNSNFDPVKSLANSYPYLSRQIDIIKPKIIMPLGSMAWDSLNKHFKLPNNYKNLTEVINSLPKEGFIKIGDTFIIPNFHPASYVDPKIMIRQYKRIWEIRDTG